MAIPKIRRDYFTYADYLNWNDGKRWEIIEGEAYCMSPAPSRKHQEVSGGIFDQFYSYLKGKNSKVYASPFDVRFSEKGALDNQVENVVQPDISVFCDTSILDERGANGSPGLIVEILSPSTLKMDFGIKLILYQKFGVKEYWIADPDAKTINVYKLDLTGKYFLDHIYLSTDSIKVGIFPDLEIKLQEIFEG